MARAEEYGRTDVNLGLVYRANLAPDLVGGGLDVRHDILYAGLNYYHPLDEWIEENTDYE